MKSRTVLIVVLIGVFIAAVGYALLREVAREESELAASLSGLVEVDPALYAAGQADIVKTDRLILYLVDPATGAPAALHILSPLVPPQTFAIGQTDSRDGTTLAGSYNLIGITDKDGEIFKVTPGEVYGRSPAPIVLGTEQVRLVLNQPFRGTLFNAAAPARAEAPATQAVPLQQRQAAPLRQRQAGPLQPPDDKLSIQGVVRVHPNLRNSVQPSDRLIILLFPPESGRPVASKIIPHVFLPQSFSISVPPQAAGKSYSLRILTDKDNNPFNSVPGEVIGRSKTPIPIGSKGVDFLLDRPYVR
ncbi:MAG: hypothetical protein O7E56_08575 [SAR324 cluster bacterium]|nr:hypothetical protein [SAR324 cluster bacterium]